MLFLGPTQKEILEIIQEHPGSTLKKITEIAKKEGIPIPTNTSTLNETIKILRDRSLIYSEPDEKNKKALVHYPLEVEQ